MVRRARRLALCRGLGHADVWDAAEPHQRLPQLTGEEGDGGVMANRSNPELGRTRQALCAIAARKSVWEPSCGLHQGPAVIRPRKVGRTHDRTRPRRTYQIALASTGWSTQNAWYPAWGPPLDPNRSLAPSCDLGAGFPGPSDHCIGPSAEYPEALQASRFPARANVRTASILLTYVY